MKMEAAEAQQADTAVTQSDAQQITPAQIATLGHVSSAGPTVTLVQLPNGQTVQVHGVIQTAQPSVIQSPQVQAVQISTIAESEDSQESVDSVTDSQKRREILSRRPSYRSILNDLSSDAPAVPRIEEEKAEEDSASAAAAATPAITTVTVPTPIYQTSSGQYTASGDVQAYQIRAAPASTIAPSVVMASSPALPTGGATEEVTRKREVRLMKNREAARECRRKKKEYVKCLENRVAVLENQNKTLIEELKALKDLYCHKSE
uniref:cAMP responsive element binding protein 1 n=1 Tax=Periophthalmus magnuspinnatus TaxID=409849 RepID=A0A3B3ZIE1_9GOBI